MYEKHGALTRLLHWVNLIAIATLSATGLMIWRYDAGTAKALHFAFAFALIAVAAATSGGSKGAATRWRRSPARGHAEPSVDGSRTPRRGPRTFSEAERRLLEQRQDGVNWVDIAAAEGGSPEALRKKLARRRTGGTTRSGWMNSTMAEPDAIPDVQTLLFDQRRRGESGDPFHVELYLAHISRPCRRPGRNP